MAQETYNIIFRGQVVKNTTQEIAKKNLAALFKLPLEKVDAMFSGNPVILKKNVSFDVASKYRVAIKKAGGVVELAPVEQASTQQENAPKRAVFTTADDAQENLHQDTSAPVVTASKSVDTSPPDASGLSLAALEGNLIRDDERKQANHVTVDTTGIDLAPVQGRLVEEHEHIRPAAISLPDSQLSIQEQTGNLVAPEEIYRPKPIEVDVSSIEMGNIGERLSPQEEELSKFPDVSHISLSDEGK